VGKDSVIQGLRSRHPDVHYAVTATTRPARPGEVDGESYYFRSRAVYDDLVDRGMLIAPANVHGHWYGAPLDPIQNALSEGQDVLLKIDVQGAMQVRRRFPQGVYIFLTAESMDVLVEHLKSRHTESEEDLRRRLHDAEFEMAQMPQYDYCVVNWERDLDRAVGDVSCIMEAERLRIHRQPIRFEDN
jgi:guanylate kinase